MKAKVNLLEARIEFYFERDQDDDHLRLNKTANNTMTDEVIYVKINKEVSEKIHPDIIGLVTILMCNPYVANVLELPLAVSSRFLSLANSVISRYDIISKIDEDLIPLSPSEDGLPGLAFSGGTDSCAALAIMPARTKCIFLKRPMTEKSKYNYDAPIRICNLLADSGFEIYAVETNLENIRNPTGFPTDLANSIPALLLSENLNLDSVSFGTVLESAFGIGHREFREYGKTPHWRFFNTLFTSVGLKLSLPVAGISEVGTSIISSKSTIAGLSQSCIRGDYRQPCLSCWKCFRKELLAHSLGQTEILNISNFLKSNEVQINLTKLPISHENVILYSIQRINLEEFSNLKPLHNKLDRHLNVDFLEKWYPNSIEFVPDKYRFTIRENILKYLEVMMPSDINDIKNWNMNKHLENPKTLIGQEKLIQFWQTI